MPQKEILLTYEGMKKLEEELEYLKTVKRREVAERIKVDENCGFREQVKKRKNN